MTEPRLRRLSFRAWRRGFKEMDLILGRFADARLATLSAADLDAFEALLAVPDQDLYAWIVGRAATPANYDTPIMAQLRAFHVASAEPTGD